MADSKKEKKEHEAADETAKETVEATDVKEDTNVKEDVAADAAEAADTPKEGLPEPTREEQLEEELAAMNDKYLRLYAEFDNYRRRTAREQIEMQRSAGSDTIREILPVLDDFERAIDSNKDTEDAEALKTGFSLIHNKLKSILERIGLKEIDAKGKSFDTDVHEAITNIPAPSKDMKGKVVDVVEKGYYLNDHVIRFSKVVVGQ